MIIARKLSRSESRARQYYDKYLEYTYHGNYKHAAHTLLICDKLTGVLTEGNKRIMIFMPPRHSKSFTVTESFPSYFLLKNPDKRVICAGYGDVLAKKFGRENRKKISEFGVRLFGLELAPDQSAAGNWGIRGHSGGLISTTIMGGATGHGADLLIIDDPIKNALEANSIAYKDRLFEEYNRTFRTRLHSGGSIILIQTRWTEDDLAGKLLNSNEENWDVISLPAICEHEKDLLQRPIGAPLWPEHGYDAAWAESTKRNIGSYVWNAMYQQRPSAIEGNLFKREWWKYYIAMPSSFDEIIMSADCAFKGNDDSDYVVIQVWGRKGAMRYLIDQVRDKMTFSGTIVAMRNLSAKWPNAYCKLVEDKANGTAVIDTLKSEITGLIPVNPEGGKIVRAQAVSPAVEAGNIYIPAPAIAPWINDFIEEFASFPNGTHDDQVDSMTQANIYFNKANQNFVYDFI